MTIARHVYEIYIRATPQEVWEAIVDPTFTAKYFLDSAVEATWSKGEGYRYLGGDRREPTAEGLVEEIEIGRRLVMSFRFLFDAALAVEPPSRVEWVVAAAGDATRLTVRHLDLFNSPLTWAAAGRIWPKVLHGLKSVVETGAGLGVVVDPEVEVGEDDPEGAWHRSQGIEANNGTWLWLGKADGERTADDDERMTMSAYAAAYHWARASGSGPVNAARAHWLLARVWAVRGNGALALHHADLAMATCRANAIADFDLAYAYEGRARALACLGDGAAAQIERAAAAAVEIADVEDRAVFDDDLRAEPWFGL